MVVSASLIKMMLYTDKFVTNKDSNIATINSVFCDEFHKVSVIVLIKTH